MRTQIKVTDLSVAQWDYLQDNLLEKYAIPADAVRVCVEFELDPEMSTRHVEMPVRAFMSFLTRLQAAQIRATAQAALTPDALPDDALPVLPTADQVRNLSAAEAVHLARQMNVGRTCNHGAAVVTETPSMFEGAEPVRQYADGCQSFGPYPPVSGPLGGAAERPVKTVDRSDEIKG